MKEVGSLEKKSFLSLLNHVTPETKDAFFEEHAEEYFAKSIKEKFIDRYTAIIYIRFLVKKYYTCKIYPFKIGRDSENIYGKPLISITEPCNTMPKKWEIEIGDCHILEDGGLRVASHITIMLNEDELFKLKEFIILINNKKIIYDEHYHIRPSFDHFKKNINLFTK